MEGGSRSHLKVQRNQEPEIDSRTACPVFPSLLTTDKGTSHVHFGYTERSLFRCSLLSDEEAFKFGCRKRVASSGIGSENCSRSTNPPSCGRGRAGGGVEGGGGSKSEQWWTGEFEIDLCTRTRYRVDSLTVGRRRRVCSIGDRQGHFFWMTVREIL